MSNFPPKKSYQTAKVKDEKEISKGTLGSVIRCSNETIFTFFKTYINEKKKLKDELDSIIKSYKEHQVTEGILKVKSMKNNNSSYTIITEPVIDTILHLHNNFKGFEIYKMFQKFNVFIKYCLDNKINLSNLKLSDIYLTKNYELKLLSINYDTEIIHKIKKYYSYNTNNTLYIIGTIMYYLYYNEYPKKNETKFPSQKHFKELLKYCLNSNIKFDYNEYINHKFFHPDVIFPNINKENIKYFNKYIEYKPNKGFLSPDCEELYFAINNEKKAKYSEHLIYSVYNSFDNSKILEEESNAEPKLFKLKSEKNKDIYIIIIYNTTFILKKNSKENFSVTQEIKFCFYNFLELSNGNLAVKDENKIIIYNKNSEDKFDIKSVILSDIKPTFLFETNENYLSVTRKNQSELYDIKNFKKIKQSNIKEIYINENIKIIYKNIGTIIYHNFFEEEIYDFNDYIECITKKKDGTYLAGGYHNYIFQLYFDKFGLVEIISKVDSGYGYYDDDLRDCMYSDSDSRYYSVGLFEECNNGDIITYSDLFRIKKIWRL